MSATSIKRKNPIAESVTAAISEYFHHLEDAEASGLYNLVLSEVERPLLESILSFAQGNQSQAARWLGLSRNTLRKMIAKYDIKEPESN